MFPRILHIYGPLWINSYGFMIALGFFLMMWGLVTHPRRKSLISVDSLWDAMFVGMVAGVVGGRALFVLFSPEEFAGKWHEVFYPWVGGFSLLGTILALLIVLPLYFRHKKIPMLPFLDLIAIFAPLMQAVSRIGCFLAGCCYGARVPASFPLGIVYTNPDCLAPLHVRMHPSQLYAALLSLGIFLFMYFGAQKWFKKPGQLLFCYLALEGLARVVVDFWRGDREMAATVLGSKWLGSIISPYQMIGIGIFALASVLFVFVTIRPKKA